MKCLPLSALIIAALVSPLAAAQDEVVRHAKQTAHANKANAVGRARAIAPQGGNQRPHFNPGAARVLRSTNYNPDFRVQPRGGRSLVTRRTHQAISPVVTPNITPAITPKTQRFGAGVGNRRGRNNGTANLGINNGGVRRDWQNDGARRRGDGQQAGRNRQQGDRNFAQGHRRWHRERQNRAWWRSRYNRFALFGGGYYYWDSGYWYPAYGYDPYFSTYTYDAPVYGYNDLEPGQVIGNVQSELRRLGYDPGPVDGDFGPATREALLNYQQDNGLSATGEIDEATLEALGLN